MRVLLPLHDDILTILTSTPEAINELAIRDEVTTVKQGLGQLWNGEIVYERVIHAGPLAHRWFARIWYIGG
jgi:hypothetical protein